VFKGDTIGRFESVNNRILQIADVKKLPLQLIKLLGKCFKMITKDPITGIGLGIGELKVSLMENHY
jgi:hypothetical protein